MKSWCVYSSSVKQCLRSVNHEQFPIQMTHSSSTTSGCNSSPSKIFHRNSSGTRTPTWNSAWTTKEKTSTRNRGAERTSLSTAKATPTARDRGTGEQMNRRLEYPRHSGWKSFPLFFFLKCTFEFVFKTGPQSSNSVNRREKYFSTINFIFQTVQRTHGPVVRGVKTGTTQVGVTCRMCERAAETLLHVLLGASRALAQSKYLNRHNPLEGNLS